MGKRIRGAETTGMWLGCLERFWRRGFEATRSRSCMRYVLREREPRPWKSCRHCRRKNCAPCALRCAAMRCCHFFGTFRRAAYYCNNHSRKSESLSASTRAFRRTGAAHRTVKCVHCTSRFICVCPYTLVLWCVLLYALDGGVTASQSATDIEIITDFVEQCTDIRGFVFVFLFSLAVCGCLCYNTIESIVVFARCILIPHIWILYVRVYLLISIWYRW